MSTARKVKDEVKQGFIAMEQMTKNYQIFVYGLNLTNEFPSPLLWLMWIILRSKTIIYSFMDYYYKIHHLIIPFLYYFSSLQIQAVSMRKPFPSRTMSSLSHIQDNLN